MRILCERVRGSNPALAITGRVKKKCADCGAAIWVSPSSLRVPNAVYVCQKHGAATSAVPGALEEVNAAMERIRRREQH